MPTIVALSLLSGLMAVDHRVGWQGLLAQPVFAGVFVGLLTGEPETAIAVGVLLELIYLSILPMRGARIPDQIAGAIVGCGTAALLIQNPGEPLFVFVVAIGVFVGLLAGELGARLTAPLLGIHNRILSSIEFSPETERTSLTRRVFWLHTGSATYVFAVETVSVLILLSAGYFAGARLTRLTGGALVEGAEYWSYLVPAVGAASLIHLFWQHHLRRLLIVCAAVVFILLWLI
ncbi:MAG: PTS sugar transporter subunit IIC [Candidatus Latescibacterota bacterium]|nr:MAG: PTS sugar transporter subunit IIC [Candidatus Latescibacterota bacterium]